MQDLTVTGNLIEAVLWFAFSAGFIFRAWRTAGPHRRLARILALAFLAFGVSDLIEAGTGAWWRPLWLLLLKSVCIAVFAYGLWEHLRLRRQERDAADGPWSVKDGVVHAQAPAALLEQMVTARIHLDDTPAENGALRLIPGSHRHGRLSDDAVEELARQPDITCAARAGDALLISPLILHASRRATCPARRRVVHFEFASPDALDPRLAWSESPGGSRGRLS